MPPEPHNPRRALSPPIGEALCLYLLYHLSRQPRVCDLVLRFGSTLIGPCSCRQSRYN